MKAVDVPTRPPDSLRAAAQRVAECFGWHAGHVAQTRGDAESVDAIRSLHAALAAPMNAARPPEHRLIADEMLEDDMGPRLRAAQQAASRLAMAAELIAAAPSGPTAHGRAIIDLGSSGAAVALLLEMGATRALNHHAIDGAPMVIESASLTIAGVTLRAQSSARPATAADLPAPAG